MSMPVVYVDRSEVREGRVENLKAAMHDLAALVEQRMPQLLKYGFYLNEDAAEMTVVAVHPDSASLELHLEAGASAFRNMGEFIVLQSIDVYGRPNEKVLDLLGQKADALGEGETPVVIHDQQAGFSRISTGVT
jgi:hypothetical protein